MRVLVADDHPLVHEVIATLLAVMDKNVEIERANDYVQILGILSKDRRFDLLITDLYMPGMDVLSGLDAIRNMAPKVPAVVFSAEENWAIIRRALRCGVAGYILKTSRPANILRDLSRVLDGEIVAPAMIEGAKENESASAGLSALEGKLDSKRPPLPGEIWLAIKVLDRLAFGIAVLDKKGKIVYMNKKIANLLLSVKRFSLGPCGHLFWDGQREGGSLARFLKSHWDNAAPLQAMRLENPEQPADSLILMLLPLKRETDALPQSDGHTIMLAIQPERPIDLPFAPFADLYGLTNSEARLTQALVNGKTVSEAARGMKITLNSARTYMKNVLHKTGTHRQADLIRMATIGFSLLAFGNSQHVQQKSWQQKSRKAGLKA